MHNFDRSEVLQKMAARFRKWFFGYNQDQVDQAVNTMLNDYQHEINNLDETIRSLAEENAALTGELKGLKELLQSLKNIIPLLETTKDHVERVAVLQVETAQIKAETLLKRGQEQAEIHRKALPKIEAEIEKTERTFKLLLESINNFRECKELNEDLPHLNGSVSDKIVGTIIPGEDINLSEPTKHLPHRSSPDPNGKNVTAFNVLANKPVPGKQKKPITGHELKDSFSENIPNDSAFPTSSVVALRKDIPLVEKEQMGSLTTHNQSAHGAPANENFPINEEKVRYITGKLSGKDIRDDDGNLIISRGDTITRDVIDRAEKAGKLAELIVHMVLAGMDLDDAF